MLVLPNLKIRNKHVYKYDIPTKFHLNFKVKMKRINPFANEFQRIKKRKEEQKLKKWYRHTYDSNIKIEDFNNCWWSDNMTWNYIESYVTPSTIWSKYNNQLGLEMYDFNSDMEYLKNLPEDYSNQNFIIEDINSFIKYEEYLKNMYLHYYLCEFV